MGRQGKEIVKANVSEVISDLLKAYADEWLAHYQYWVAAMWLKGVDADTFRPILLEMSQHELKHAEKLANASYSWAVGLSWISQSSSQLAAADIYRHPKTPPTTGSSLRISLRQRACAIKFYSQMVEKYSLQMS
jgi:bacterioferritin